MFYQRDAWHDAAIPDQINLTTDCFRCPVSTHLVSAAVDVSRGPLSQQVWDQPQVVGRTLHDVLLQRNLRDDEQIHVTAHFSRFRISQWNHLCRLKINNKQTNKLLKAQAGGLSFRMHMTSRLWEIPSTANKEQHESRTTCWFFYIVLINIYIFNDLWCNFRL